MNKLALRLAAATAGLAMVGSLMSASLALADNNKGNNGKEQERGKQERMFGDDNSREVKNLGSTLEIHITDNGKALVRGAKVTAISSTTITAVNTWGSTTVAWTVTTDGNTKFVQKNNKGASVNDVKVGDIISFTGNVVSTASSLTVQADMIKDWSMIQQQNTPATLQGSLKSVASTTAPTSFVLTIGGIDYTVNVSATTAVLNNAWLTIGLANLQVGNIVRVYGTVDSVNHIIGATVVRDISI